MAIQTQGWEDIESINDLNDVNGSVRSDGDILRYRTVSGNMEYEALPDPGGGTTIEFFQVQDDGVSTQLTTGTFTDLAGIWDTPTLTGSNFTWSGSSGTLDVIAAGTIEFDILVSSWNNANNRHELHVRLLQNGTELVEASTYTSRNNTQDEGSVIIPGFKVAASIGDEFKLQVLDVGVEATIGGTTIPNQTYLSAKLYI